MNDYPENWGEIATRRKEEEGYRCERCNHPDDPGWYEQGDEKIQKLHRGFQHCDPHCSHPGVRLGQPPLKQRVLTVHHLDGDKANCSDTNLAVLCQVCHLHVQAVFQANQRAMFSLEELFGEWILKHVKENRDHTINEPTIEDQKLKCPCCGRAMMLSLFGSRKEADELAGKLSGMQVTVHHE